MQCTSLESDKAIFNYYSSVPNICVVWSKHVEEKSYHKPIKVLFLTHVLIRHGPKAEPNFIPGGALLTGTGFEVSHTLDF